ncbi:MAG: radical SAM protein [Oscillospiraceae bacterium]|nr:radical SAM protein [Oscillospiraceae bacterium]
MQDVNAHIRDRLRVKSRFLGVPTEGSFELTPRCTMNCKMCYIVLSEQEQRAIAPELTAAQWISLGEKAAKAGMLYTLFTGGEPFLRKDFKEIYQAFYKLGLLITINTNATLITPEVIAWLKEQPPYKLNISLYGGSNATYERLCAYPNGYDRVTKAIDLLLEAGIAIKIALTVTPENQGDIAAVRAFADARGLPMQCATYMFPSYRKEQPEGLERIASEQLEFTIIENDTYLNLPEQRFKQLKDMREYILEQAAKGEKIPTRMDRIRCGAGRSSFWITWQGLMYPCGMMKQGESEPLKIGFDAAWQAVREASAALEYPKKCRECEYGFMCNACIAQIKAEGEDYEYLCKTTKNTYDTLLKGELTE